MKNVLIGGRYCQEASGAHYTVINASRNNVLRAGADHPRTPRLGRTGEGGKRALSRCKGGTERALLVMKGRIRW